MSGGSDLKPRLVSGLIAFAVVTPVLAIGSFEWVLGLAALAAGWGLHEIVSMGMPKQRRSAFPLILLLGAPWFLSAAYSTSGGIPGVADNLPEGVSDLLVAVVVSMVVSAAYFLGEPFLHVRRIHPPTILRG